ncbi:WAT1-related protein At3g28050-like isoform X2 [Diospyros lotus]|uniref:WAT1-related protein At3g28050-like isoform X2 n=1 Tax=Diospyros lotus TaxID=55363 RepID=UPI00224ED976|nr:WAT1-related protein At3g28050-like isoform X2 [Diospyros lotus]
MQSLCSWPHLFFSLSGIGFANPTLASAMNNLVPAYTFLLAILIRMEKLNLNMRSSQAKSIGTIVSITGALVVALYRGPSINFFKSSSSSAPSSSSSSRSTKLLDTLLSPPSRWSIGGVVLAVASFLKALLYVCQAWCVKEYPAELMLTLISSIFAAIISGILFLVAENGPNAWKVSSKTELIAVTCFGIYGIAVRGCVHMWAMRWNGPIFVAMFKPLGIVIAMVAGVLFLGDKLHLGSIIGGATIAVGFYTVMWGKTREEKVEEDNNNMSGLGVDSFSPKAPLLQKEEA